ncbi:MULTISPECIES: hypothetical protein [Bradyrhizobium]|jgi:hypothetical protein|uniref:hypothetical protein n=1 Tax=Bradyrhizobium TaxID=374 RepID=UPI000231D0C7|nr:hypothetical protein [Bradyrhizobium japonicum]AJA63902.1 hypothetical protein RN69_28940 [Bradyrhizobium japonicum]KMJ96061.1 hypothetical protein CF64_28750 [Bradyrhizobium japonicum]MCS3539312.1 hypothetical protein [Bradyrhizobium japonicum]MCS3993486.1 hypothetical protein [Bradyrhizobium japonicum]MCS4020582.1 hypothetical protein [Bradyrhizobium japonicum]
MRKASPAPAGKFRDIVAIGAAFRAQREIDAKRALRRYGHLLAQSHETSRLNEIIPVCNEEDIFENANRVDPRERAAGRTTFERA